ncbi:MAG: SRPBCC domain-containing protein [Gemmatimonadaceae bacterium]|nr:SRPBCC domain-containing protein [Gemmatimonadaceae bacterium]
MSTSGTNAARGFVVDHGSHTVRFERDVDAPRTEVFAAWTTPEQVTAWWDPDGEPLVACEIDLRAGGAFAFTNRAHSAMPFAGVYREIVPPERLVFEAMGATGRVSLEESPRGTHMVVEIVCRSAEHLEQFMKMGVHEGTARTVDNLVSYVISAASASRTSRQ